MNSKATEQNVRMLSLMERMERPMTYHQAMLNESNLLMESERVNMGTFLEFMTKYQINKGKFVHVGYIQLYETVPAYPTDEYYDKVTKTRDDFVDNSRNLSRFDKWSDKMQNTEWNSPTGRKKKGEDIHAMAKNLYPLIIKFTDYTLNWQTPKDYKDKSSEAFAKLGAARNAMSDATRTAIGMKPKKPSSDGTDDKKKRPEYHAFGELGNYDISTFGVEGENGEFTPERQTYRTDVNDPKSEVSYDRTAILNYMANPKAQHAYYFGVDENGNIDPLPKKLGELLHGLGTIRKLSGVTDEEQKRLAEQFASLEKIVNSSNKTLLMENVAFLCGFVSSPGEGRKSVYWINPNPMFLLSKKEKGVTIKYLYDSVYNKMDEEQLKALLNKYARSSADELESEGNPNIAGNTMYADDSFGE